MTETGNRRPLASRDTAWARAAARWLARTGLTPNQISIGSILFAALAGLLFQFSSEAAGTARVLLLLGAAAGCQLRLLCNMLDGMVAIEGGKGEQDGPFWNEFPDRIDDILIFAGAGFACGAPGLGWLAACLAVLTAYVRELGHSAGAPVDFSGPMAKPHRMAALTVATLIACAEPLWGWQDRTLQLALILIALGSAFTAFRRARNLVRVLKTD